MMSLETEPNMNLRFDGSQIENIAKKYEYSEKEKQLMQLRKQIQNEGHLNKEQLRLVAEWK